MIAMAGRFVAEHSVFTS